MAFTLSDVETYSDFVGMDRAVSDIHARRLYGVNYASMNHRPKYALVVTPQDINSVIKGKDTVVQRRLIRMMSDEGESSRWFEFRRMIKEPFMITSLHRLQEQLRE
jgi:hypothetical protein